MFEIGGRIREERPGPAQFPQFVKFGRRDIPLLVAAKTDDIGNDEAVPLVGFDLADVQPPQGVGLDGVEDTDGEPPFAQGGVEGQPVVAGGLHTDEEIVGVGAEGRENVQEPLESGSVVMEAESLVGDLTRILQNNGFMAAFGDINTYDEHDKTPRNRVPGSTSPTRWIISCWEMRRKRGLRHPADQ